MTSNHSTIYSHFSSIVDFKKVCVCPCVHICVCLLVCKCVCAPVCVYICVCMRICLFVCVSPYAYLFISPASLPECIRQNPTHKQQLRPNSKRGDKCPGDIPLCGCCSLYNSRVQMIMIIARFIKISRPAGSSAKLI